MTTHNIIYPTLKQSFGIAGIVILGTLVFSPLLMRLSSLVGSEAAAFLYYLLSMGIPLWIVFTLRKKSGQTEFNFKVSHPRVIPFIVISTPALVFGAILPITELIPVPESVQESLPVDFFQTGVFNFIITVVVAPIFEELIFRGIMLDGLLKRYNAWKSILVTSLLFGLVHLNPWQFLAGLFLGLFIGWIYHETKSLAMPILIHAVANFCGYLVRLFSSPDAALEELYGGTINLTVIVSMSVVSIAVCLYYLRKGFLNTTV
jgi:membrane protease YdiL (CAAX protease family)